MAIQFDHTANGLVTITTTNAASPSPYTLRLPDGTGSNGQVLTTDGTGNLSFTTTATTYDSLTTKPAVNVIFTGDVTGAGNVLLEKSGNNNLSIALTIAANSVALGTDTTGNYVANVIAGTGIVASGGGSEGSTVTVSLPNSGVTAGSYGNANVVSQITVDAQGRITSASNVVINKVFNLVGGNTITACGMTQHTAINTNTFNFFAGQCAGNAITTGSNNIAIGNDAGRSITTGRDNNFLGWNAGRNNSSGQHNNFFGNNAGFSNTTGVNNIFIGRDSGYFNVSGSYNFFAGWGSGGQNTTGFRNIFLGTCAGYYNTSGSFNIFLGDFAGFGIGLIGTGSNNFFAGLCAGFYNGASDNIFIGRQAGYFNEGGSCNVYAGVCAGYAGSAGQNNVAIGRYAGCNNNAYDNIFLGNSAGRCGGTGARNIFLGACAGFNHEGLDNIAIGTNAGSSLTFGTVRQNVFIGVAAGCCNTCGCFNTFLGPLAGFNNTTGCRNIYLASTAGNITTGHDNIVLGNLTSCAGLTASTSNTIIFATGGIARYCTNGVLGNTTITGNVTATNFFGSGAGLTGIVLGTNTDGNYVASVSAGLGVTVTGGTGEGATPTIAANVRSVGTFTGDVSNTQLLSSILQVDGSGSNLDADLLDGQQGTYYLNYNNLTNDPAANIALTGDVTGAANAILLANSTIFGITTTLVNSGVTAGSYGNANAVPRITVDAKGRVTAASNLLIDRNYGLITNKPSVNVTFTGDVTGIANVNLANENTNSVSVALTIASNSVALGTDTTGNYVANVIAGAGIVASGGGSETSTVTISHLDTSSVGNVSSDNSNGVVIQDITLGFDTFGHVTGASVATVDLDTRYLRTSGATLQTVQGNVIFEGNVEFLGNVVTISANNLIVSDNFIYLNDGNNNINIDFGFVGNYNDGVYRHAGFFRDATDGYFKVFDNYAPEPDAGVDIDTGNVTYREANFKANIFLGNRLDVGSISGNSIVASANIFTAGNLIVGQAVRTSGGALFWNSGNDGTGSGLDADLLDGQNGTYYLDYNNLINDPAANIALTGDVTGSASNVLRANSTIISLATTLASTGVAASTYGNAKIIPSFTVDAKGRLTNAANVAIALDYADLVTKPSINLTFTGGATGSGNLLIANSTNSLSVALSLVEADTLATVTGRGATTATAVTFTNATEATSNSSGAVQVTGGLGVSGNIYGGRVIVTGRSHAANVGLNSAIIGGSINTNAGANSFIGGGIRNVVLSQQSGIVAGTSNRITGASSSNSVILGGGCNLITSSADSTILGSKNTTIDSVSQGFSIASTTGSHAAGTQTGEIASCGATASGTRTVLIGTKDSLFGPFAQNSAILGVDFASIYCKNSVIAGGADHDIFADNSVILGGAKGCGDVRGKVIMPGHAWTIWTDLGSAQVGKQTLVNQTSTSAGSNVLINGSGAADFTNSIGIRNNHVYVVKGTITAANATGTTKVWDYTTSAKANATGTITFVGNYGTGNAIINTIAADPGTDTWAVRFVSGKSGTEGWITANVTGNTSTIRWLLTSETSELKFA